MDSTTFAFKTTDEHVVDIDAKYVRMAETLSNACFDENGVPTRPDGPTSVPATRDVLCHIFAYLALYAEKPRYAGDPNKLLDWEREFFAPMKYSTLFEFINAADFFAAKPAMHTACKFLASQMRGKSAEQITALLSEKNE